MAKPSGSELTRFEKVAVSLFRFANETPSIKRAQTMFHDQFTRRWVALTVCNRLFVDGLETVHALAPDRGVLLCSNHRSFFDMYVTMLVLFHNKVSWLKRVYFPVRSDFFYETPAGVFLNAAIGGGTMYPPIFRDRSRAPLNDDAVARISRFLGERGSLVGMHPEGTRNKTNDPYTLLPSQPGIGQMVLRGKPIVLPMFINGLNNDFAAQTRMNWRAGTHVLDPVILTFGEPVDYDEFTKTTPRLALYKRSADRIHEHLHDLGQHEKKLRAQIVARELDGDPRWHRWRPVNGVG